ncbi:MAG: hypothetical protein RBR59_02580 [Sulfurimonadaceae bacterium]|jgi:hypothetical protein|nr:hypothetical protein [Sulfurimonadaceae bacterium]
MKLILSLFLACATLFGSVPFTLDKLQNLRFLVLNKTDFITPADETIIKTKIKEKLTKRGITFDSRDASTLMITIDTFMVDKIYIVHTQFIIGEEVQTFRTNEVNTLAYTYHGSDLIDTKEPYADTIESIEYLTNEFLELFDEDNHH